MSPSPSGSLRLAQLCLRPMETLVLSTPASEDHLPPSGHPERIERHHAALAGARAAGVEIEDWVTPAGRPAVERVHTSAYIDHVFETAPASGHVPLDADTTMSPGSLSAALDAAGAAIEAVDRVFSGGSQAVFVAARPPGHHAEPDRAMGFCLFNTVAVAAMHAIRSHGSSRVAVVDIDVHHGNGTQAFAETEPRLSFVSLHQGWIYPGTGAAHETGAHGNVLNIPFQAGTRGEAWLERFDHQVLPRLERDEPDVLFVSAGFDAHRDDPLAGLALDETTYAAIGARLAAAARALSHSRLVCVLEGGYDCAALERSVEAFLGALKAG